MSDDSSLYPLEASDEYGLQGIADRDDLHEWLESWLLDEDSRECKLEKLPNFKPNKYV